MDSLPSGVSLSALVFCSVNASYCFRGTFRKYSKAFSKDCIAQCSPVVEDFVDWAGRNHLTERDQDQRDGGGLQQDVDIVEEYKYSSTFN